MKKENLPSKILLVDDEPDILILLKHHLQKEGYMVQTASNGKEGLEIAKSFLPDLILLDLMMPELDGVGACEKIRQIDTLKDILVVFLTARGEDYSQIAAFDAGGDDFITKPIRPNVFVSKIKALLKRAHSKNDNNTDSIIGNESLFLNPNTRQVYFNGKEIDLPKKEYILLKLFLKNPNKVLTREQIFIKVWGGETLVGDRTLDVHVRKLRKKIGNDTISTIVGIGYKLKL